jgi:hypothetical protein
VTRDDLAIADYEKKARVFLAEVDRELEVLATLGNVAAVLREAAYVGA